MEEQFEKRLKELEDNQKEIYQRLTALEITIGVINTKLDNIKDSQRDLKDSIKEVQDSITKLSARPGQRWDSLVTTAVSSIVTGIICFFIGKLTR